MSEPTKYRVSYRYLNAVNPYNYPGTQPLVPSSEIRVGPIDLELPERLRGRRLKITILVEEEAD